MESNHQYITYLIGYTRKTEVDAIEHLAKVVFSNIGPAGPAGLRPTPMTITQLPRLNDID